MSSDTQKAIDAIKKAFGPTALFKSTDKPQAIDAISTGSLSLDRATGIGGFPIGRISEIFGMQSSGKSTVCLRAVANAQKMFPDKVMAYVDMERALDYSYAEKLGVDMDRMLIATPRCGEEALEIVKGLVKGKVPIVIVDSVATLTPRKVIEGELGDSEMGALARLMSSSLKVLNLTEDESETALVFTNQIRQKIGVMFGSPDTRPGGLSLNFYASMQISLYSRNITKSKEVVGIHTIATVVKNKLAVPYRKAEFDVNHNTGIDRLDEIVILGKATGVLQAAGASFSYNGEKIGVGKEAVKVFLLDKPAMIAEIERKILAATFVPTVEVDEE